MTDELTTIRDKLRPEDSADNVAKARTLVQVFSAWDDEDNVPRHDAPHSQDQQSEAVEELGRNGSQWAMAYILRIPHGKITYRAIVEQ